MDDGISISEETQNRVILQIVELQREYYLENKNKDTERQRKLREIIDRATPLREVR
jgi:hypothetical protein